MFGRIVPDYEVSQEEGEVIIEGVDPITDESYKVTVEAVDYIAFRRGTKLIQNAFPYLSPEERDIVLMGLTAEGLERYMGGESGRVETSPTFTHVSTFFTLDDLR